MSRIIIHVDMDAFYASVEVRDDPSLAGKPLIIGSLPDERGVVATCSYEARKYGVRSGMNIKEAYNLCPNGIYMHPNMEKYKLISSRLHEIWDSFASASETIAYDEAYLDVTEQAVDFDGARRIAIEIKERTKNELGLTCSVGVAYCKAAAKTASEEKKPNGYFEILNAKEYIDLIKDRDVRVLYTVGEKTAEKLHAAGIHTVKDIQTKPDLVIRLLGKQGQWITKLAVGKDERRVAPYLPENAKSISREVTFQEDVEDYGYLRDVLLLLSICVENRAKRYRLLGKGVTLKLTYADMKGITRSKQKESCTDAAAIYRESVRLLEQVEQRPVRLIGVGIYNLEKEDNRQLTLFDILKGNDESNAAELKSLLVPLQENYRLDFASHLEDIATHSILHKTIEYMRKYKGRKKLNHSQENRMRFSLFDESHRPML